jgi:hypothetical protein
MAFLTTAESFRLLKEGGLDFTNAIVTPSPMLILDSHCGWKPGMQPRESRRIVYRDPVGLAPQLIFAAVPLLGLEVGTRRPQHAIC